MKLKFIFFDYGGTIDSDGVHWRKRFYELYLKNGINISYDDFSKAFFDSDDNLPRRHNLKGLGLYETVKLEVSDVFKYLKIKDIELEKKIVDEFINDSKKYIMMNLNLFKNLKEKGIKLGIISNFYGNLESVLKSIDILHFFDVVADSGVVGHIKPDKEIFEWALKKINASPELSAMVGDALHRDIKGAHNIGIYHFYISNEESPKCCEKFIQIKNIREIIKYV